MKKANFRYLQFVRMMGLCTLTGFGFHSSLASTPDIEIGVEYQWFYQRPDIDINNDANRYNNRATHTFITLTQNVSFADQWLFEIDSYAAWNQQDSSRSRIDFQSLAMNFYGESFDLKAGFVTEFWGVTESRHLVDILNQVSLADSLDEETKLGQPMIKWQKYWKYGNLQLFWLPWFRERVFSESGKRLTPAIDVKEEHSLYASGAKRKHQDFAIRYTHTLDAWDIGISYFKGTGREPLLLAQFGTATEPDLIPLYEQIEQGGLDLQHSNDGLLLKLEAIKRNNSHQQNYYALVSGFEYTHIGLFNSAIDTGFIVEYLYDQRNEHSTTAFQDDMFIGLRVAVNNIAQTHFLVGYYQDMHTSTQALRLELDTRLRDNWVLALEVQGFRNTTSDDPLHYFRHDDYIKIIGKYYL